MAAKSNKKQGGPSLVPVLFTIGVIGWGFFAIDRLTTPSYRVRSETPTMQRSSNYSKPTDKSQSWKETFRKTLGFFHKETQPAPKQNTTAQIPILPEENYTPVQNDPPATVAHQEVTNQRLTPPELPTEGRSLYFYKEDHNGFTLEKITLNHDLSLKELFSAVIRGPSSANTTLIDSFPVKPTVNHVAISGDTVEIDLDDNFGFGVSYQTLNLQIAQFLAVARQLPGVINITIKINGQTGIAVGSDGVVLPDRINSSNSSLSLHD